MTAHKDIPTYLMTGGHGQYAGQVFVLIPSRQRGSALRFWLFKPDGNDIVGDAGCTVPKEKYALTHANPIEYTETFARACHYLRSHDLPVRYWDGADIIEPRGWIGAVEVDTLAEYDHWRGIEHVGAPIEPMVLRVQGWLSRGEDVRIFTARVSEPKTFRGDQEQVRDMGVVVNTIHAWLQEHVGLQLPITNVKDYAMKQLWDDRAVAVEHNTGEVLGGNAYEY